MAVLKKNNTEVMLESVEPTDLINGVYNIPSGVTHIQPGAFYNVKTLLKKVIFPSSVESIGSHAFDRCTVLEDVIMTDNIRKIEAKAFKSCSNLKQITIPGSVEDIGDHAFYGSGLINVNIRYGVARIGESAFGYCDLKNVAIPGTVNQIASNAFICCDQLTIVTILYGVSRIERSAFYACNNLAHLTLPGSITALDCEAFPWWNKKLNTISIEIDEPDEFARVCQLIPPKIRTLIKPFTPVSVPEPLTHFHYSTLNSILEPFNGKHDPLNNDIRERISEWCLPKIPSSLLTALSKRLRGIPIPSINADCLIIRPRPELNEDCDISLYDAEIEKYNQEISHYNAEMKRYEEELDYYKTSIKISIRKSISDYHPKLIFINRLIDYLRVLEQVIPSQSLFGARVDGHSKKVNTLDIRRTIKKIISLLQDEQPISLSDEEKKLIAQRKSLLDIIPVKIQQEWELSDPLLLATITP